MTKIQYSGNEYVALPGDSVLETLEKAGEKIPNSCRSGICQTCLMQARVGSIPPAAQVGLRDTLQEMGYFLACQCHPEEDIEASLAGDGVLNEVPVQIKSLHLLSPSVMQVTLKPEREFKYRRGQFINLTRKDGVSRSYSLSGCVGEDHLLELHVRHIPGGAMSDWLMQGKNSHDLSVQGPLGSCFYIKGGVEQPMLLVGTGTGLAPLYGILCDALSAGHTGPIHLYHGARSENGLYMVEQLRSLAHRHANLQYTACILTDDDSSSTDELVIGSLEEIVFARHPNLKGWRSFLCGNPEIVTRFRKRAYLAGAALGDIYADAFLPAVAPS